MSYRPDTSLPSTNSFSFVSRTLAGTFSLLGLTATFDTSKLHESKSDVSSLAAVREDEEAGEEEGAATHLE